MLIILRWLHYIGFNQIFSFLLMNWIDRASTESIMKMTKKFGPELIGFVLRGQRWCWLVAMNWPLLLLVSFLLLVAESNEESVAYQPVSVGLTFGTPVDLTNTIQNVLTGPFGVVLTSLLGVVLLAGLLAPQFDHRRHRRSNDPMPRYTLFRLELLVHIFLGKCVESFEG